MNATVIKKLSEQCCALLTFRDRCTWDDVVFSVGNYSLDNGTSVLINSDIREVVRERIDLLKERIKTEAVK